MRANREELLTETQKELGRIIRPILKDDDTYIGTMLMLTVNQPDADKNCQELLDFIQSNPNAGYDEVMDKVDEIMDIENPFTDED